MRKFLIIILFFLNKSYSQSLHFDGINDYVVTSYSTLNANVTYECWVWSSEVPNTTVGMDGPIYGENFGILWNHYPAFVSSAYVRNILGNYYSASFGPLNANTWYHLAATYDGITLKAYKNGVLMSETPVPDGGIYPPTKLLTLGSHPGNNYDYFEGAIDEVRIWNAVRTCEEINQFMNDTLQGNETGLDVYYKFNEGIPFGTNTNIPLIYNSVAQTADGTLQNFSLSGGTSNFIQNFTPSTGTNLCQTTSSNNSSITNTIKLFPNPAHNIINFSIPVDFEIYSLTGQLIQKGNNTNQVSVESLINGVYLIKIIDENNTIITEKLIKN